MTAPSSLADIRNKVRRITGRPSQSQITDSQIDDYINTFYVFDMPEHLRMESLRVNYQFLTSANIPVYDFPTDFYLTTMPPIFIAGYQSYLTQSREAFFRINPELQLNQTVGQGSAIIGAGPYPFTLTNTPIVPGFKRNPPGAYHVIVAGDSVPVNTINWNVVVSGTSSGASVSLVDDGLGNLWDVNDTIVFGSIPRGSIDYVTGVGSATFTSALDAGTNINVQYVPYVASRSTSAVFYQDQIALYPIPDQVYTISLEAYKYPTAFIRSSTNPPSDPDATKSPQLKEWWQLLAYGAADKIFADNGDIENMQKFRPLLDEQMRLMERRTIVQMTSDRTATIYTDQTGTMGQFPFGNNFNF
jgi:hypothetical protein